ncbi:MAG: ABC transporter permease [Dehalococcoidia bacterium]|uniref:ABC transporter permease n=1 Tax=Candidatus Amarobacter glycogenicus TaxID=3140699 RepID=UPI001E031E12|nr:ABC transporter permease [Dehalococcoidia bacterium]MBK6560288.1 ABC transporter permease [Dehalococcoidia bacterium]MBK7125886.1 ABC transporter permease [Dehalococcoidia bacterium]MBK7328458.1 ABC transporter permease [Dehalococcoidia bacterium]MBK7726084.1 ABC transporter permease [Dehalococcoidia bacterium]
MRNYILRRVVVNIPVIWLVATLVFLATSVLPGDFVAQRIAAQDPTSTDPALRAAQIDAVRKDLGLDKPVVERYVRYLGHLVVGDFGVSYQTREPALKGMRDGLPYSLQLAFMSLFVGLSTALPIGIISAIRQDSMIDYVLRIFAILVLAMPSFWVGTMLLLYTVKGVSFFGLFEIGWTVPLTDPKLLWEDPGSSIRLFVIPAVAGGLASAAGVMRLLRSQMLEVLRQDYIRTAWAKGMRERVVILRHAMKNAMVPVVTVLGLTLAGLLSGNVVFENLFGIPGVGRRILVAIQARDVPVVQAFVLVIATFIVFVNLGIDLLYGVLDPRIRYS